MNKELIELVSKIENDFTYLLPDDDDFWENHRDDINEIYSDLKKLVMMLTQK